MVHSPFSTASPPENSSFAIAVDPTNRFVYTANTNDSALSAFLINSDGTLTSLGTTDSGSTPVSLAIVQGTTLTFVYSVNQGDNSVSQFTICAPPTDCSPTGSLINIATTQVGSETAQAVAASPDGRFLYVADLSGANVRAFTIDPASGALTILPAAFQTGQSPAWIAIDPTSKFLYTVNGGPEGNTGASISPFNINGDGSLTSIGPAVLLNGQVPVDAIVDPSGTFLYVLDQGSQLQETYAIGPTGAVTFANSSPARGGNSFAITSPFTLTFGSEYLYATNSNSNSISGAPLDPLDGAVGTVTSTPSQQALPGPVIADPPANISLSPMEPAPAAVSRNLRLIRPPAP